MLAPWKKDYDKPRQCSKKQRYHFASKVCTVKAMFFFPVVMYRYDMWTIRKVEHSRTDAFLIVVLEKTLESTLDSKEGKPVNPKGNQP